MDPRKQDEQDAITGIKSSSGFGGIANKGIRRPNANRFHKHVQRDPRPSAGIRELADQLYRQDHGSGD